MVFSSSLFLLYFFPFFLLVYYLIPSKLRNYWILAGSFIFYVWGAPKYIFIVILSIVIDFFIARAIHRNSGKRRKAWMAAALIINISFLLYFKYANFFVDNINSLLLNAGAGEMQWIKVALPIGISFFTFHEMSYIIDVYRGVKPPFRKMSDYAVYILFFPQLIAGPIIRFNEIADQILDRRFQDNIDNRLAGFFRFSIGLGKKVLIANVMGAQADLIFSQGIHELSTPMAWLGILAYTFQIYFDFSGYSDMAIGMARMMGFIFPENFNNPYISSNITEFWRRWHMTLGRWMRDYLYIPLGGNKVSKWRMYLNLWIVFLISGLWHGAAWNFIFWGAFHGFFLMIDRMFLIRFLDKLGRIPSILFTFFVTVMGWVLFRMESPQAIGSLYSKLFSWDMQYCDVAVNFKFQVIFVLAILFSFWGIFKNAEKIQERFFSPDNPSYRLILQSVAGIMILMLSISSITSYGFNPFIYYRF
jgi:alginate O-acetyltransferase complex protein AlgI